MNPKTERFKAILSDVRARYATAKRRAEYVTSGGCNYICSELDKIIEEASEYAKSGDFALAYAVCAIVLQKCGWLSSYADSSSGWLTDTVYRTQEVIRYVCKSVPKDSHDAKYIFTHGLKDCQHKDFDGWEQYPYGMLRSIAILTDEDAEQKLYDALNALDSKFGKEDYSGWIELGHLVRYEVILATAGEIYVDAFLAGNLNYDAIRKIAIDTAVEHGQYDKAEALCLDRISTHKYHEKPYTRPSEWDYLLYNIYEQAGNEEKQVETAEKLLFLYDVKYFAVLKNLLGDKWHEKYPQFREALQRELPCELLMQILAEDNDVRHLFEQVRNNTEFIFTYGKQLLSHYADEVRNMCLDEIRRGASRAATRGQYKGVCGKIKKLYELSNLEQALFVIADLKKAYPHRPAFLEELDSLAAKLEKADTKRKK